MDACPGPALARRGLTIAALQREWVMTVRRMLVLALTASGCGDGVIEGTDLFSEDDDVARVASEAAFDTLWVVGGADDTLLAAPALVRPDGKNGVVVFDLQSSKAYRFGADGLLHWSWGQRGEGPGEIKNVRALDVLADGTVVLVDSGNGRIVSLDAARGELVTEVPLPAEVGIVRGVSALSGDRLAVHGSRVFWGVVDAGDVREAGSPVGLGELQSLQHQGAVSGWADERWVFGFAVGNGWMVFHGDSLASVHPYIEHLPFPAVRWFRQGARTVRHHVRRPPETGRTLSVIGDTLFVLFGGRGALRGRQIDKYDLRTGEYIESDAIPHYANQAVVSPGRLFTINNSSLYPTIVALARSSRSSP